MTDLTNPSTERFRMMPSEVSVEGSLGASSAGQGAVTPNALAPTLDLAALRGWIEAGIRMAKEHALEVIARAEAAEAKIAAVRASVLPYYEADGHACDDLDEDCARCVADEAIAALDGTA